MAGGRGRGKYCLCMGRARPVAADLSVCARRLGAFRCLSRVRYRGQRLFADIFRRVVRRDAGRDSQRCLKDGGFRDGRVIRSGGRPTDVPMAAGRHCRFRVTAMLWCGKSEQ